MLFVILSLLLVLSSPVRGYDFDVRNLTIVSVTSNGACTDVYPAALNCTLPAVLFIYVSGVSLVSPILASAPVLFILQGNGADASLNTVSVKGNSSLLTGKLRLDGFSLGMMGQVLSLSVYDTVSGNSSAPFYGVSIAPLPIPTLQTISGCRGGGAATYDCLPDVDSLTITGSGLQTLMAVQSLEVVVVNPAGVLAASRISSQLQYQMIVFNDSVAVLPLALVYKFVLQLAQFGGTMQTIGFDMQWYSEVQRIWVPYYTNRLPISFAPLPLPVVSSAVVSGSNVLKKSNATGYTNCYPGNKLVFSGHYLYEVNVTLRATGKQPQSCDISYDAINNVPSYWLPVIADDEDGLPWDVIITNPSGSLILPSLITYTTQPAIGFVVPCNSYGQYISRTTCNCEPGASLTIRGMRFPIDPSIAIVLGGTRLNVSCLQPVFVDSTTLTCVVPVLNGSLTALYGSGNFVQVLFPTTGLRTSQWVGNIVAAPNSPLIHNVSGCEANNGSFVLQRCRGGDVLVVQGSFLLSTVVNIEFLPSVFGVYCKVLPVSTNERVLCQLPFLLPGESFVQADRLYTMYYQTKSSSTGLSYGHPFQLSFTWDPILSPTPQPLSNSSATMDSGVLATAVVVPVLVVLLVLVAIWLLRRRVVAKSGGAVDEQESAGSGWAKQTPGYTRFHVGSAVELR